MSMSKPPNSSKLIWLTDLHLDRAEERERQALYQSIRSTPAERVVITGDISTAEMLPLHLRQLAAAASPRSIYFVLGNHDFYGSSFAAVESMVAGVCKAHDNLCRLGHGELIRLTDDTALVGHDGCGDGRMGWGRHTLARNPDFDAIEDFKGLSRKDQFDLLGKLGAESARYLRSVLPYTLTCYEHVFVATHVPPFTAGACFGKRPCDYLRQPFYVNIAMGGFLLRLAESFPTKRITVLAGHTHCAAKVQARPNLELRVGGAKPGNPKLQPLIDIATIKAEAH
jgi:3',5'-cyclic-AMP phosphodiesterase